MDASCGSEHGVHIVEEVHRSGLLHEDRRISGPKAVEQQVGTRLLDRGDVGGEFCRSEFWEQRIHELHIRHVLRKNRLIGVPGVVTVGIVVGNPHDALGVREVLGSKEAAAIASVSLSVLRNVYAGSGMVSSTPSCVVPSHIKSGVSSSSAIGAVARDTPVEMRPSTALTSSSRTSLRIRSTVSCGLLSSSTRSSTCRPRIPPSAFTRSAHHSTARCAASPTGAVTPERATRRPIFSGSSGTFSGASALAPSVDSVPALVSSTVVPSVSSVATSSSPQPTNANDAIARMITSARTTLIPNMLLFRYCIDMIPFPREFSSGPVSASCSSASIYCDHLLPVVPHPPER